MKIRVSEESVVYQGPAYEDTIWGVMQFPRVEKCSDGALAICIHNADDSWTEAGKNKEVWCVSKNGGLTWEVSENVIQTDVGELLPNGDRIFFPSVESICCKSEELKKPRITTRTLPTDNIKKEEDGSWPYPVFMFRDVFGCEHYIYDFDTLPDEYSKKEWTMYRIKKGESKAVKERVEIHHPNMSAHARDMDSKGNFAMLRPTPLGSRCCIDKDGTIWMTSYTGGHLNPYTRGVDIYSAVTIYKSTDNAHSFELAGYIPFKPDTTKNPTSYLGGGFNESALEIMDDGSMIILMRTADVFYGGPEWNTMYYSRSVDGGKTFSEPEQFDKIGVLPRLVKLDCGVTLAAYGRPGIYVRASEDPSGVKWQEPVEIMTSKDRSALMNNPPEHPNFHQWAGSCCNVDLKPIGPNQAIIAYSDFYYPDQSGKTDKKLKTILTRIITIDE